jgi:hypothetical protein
LNNEHRILTATKTPVRTTLGEAPDDKLAPSPED